jgi:hypothetical protein
VVPGAGHNLPQEAPRVFADAVLELVRGDCGFIGEASRAATDLSSAQ